jgi:FkbM family methyltransferase
MKFSNYYRYLRLALLRKTHATHGNVHQKAETAVRKHIPFSNEYAFLRPTVSDFGRVSEYTRGLYFQQSYLHTALKNLAPIGLIDIGANIGLSTLSLKKEFPSITSVVGIEAERENFGVLEKNYQLWTSTMQDTKFSAINAVATASENAVITSADSLATLTGKNTASGTFRFEEGSENDSKRVEGENVITPNQAVNLLEKDGNFIVKVDIEGGEEHLFSEGTDWLRKCAFIAIELHDRYHPVMLHSSQSFINAISEHDFAVVPTNDVLQCYNRNLVLY